MEQRTFKEGYNEVKQDNSQIEGRERRWESKKIPFALVPNPTMPALRNITCSLKASNREKKEAREKAAF